MPTATLLHLLVQLALIIGAARLMGALFRRLGQPTVMGEFVAGILLGPSLLGWLAPQGFALLFPADTRPYLSLLAQLGLVFYMFLVGLEFDAGQLRQRLGAAVAVSQMGILLPFSLGLGLAVSVLHPLNQRDSGAALLPFALFCGVAMAITAFSVLARILSDRQLIGTPLGTLALTCASIDDVTAWCLLAVTIAVARSGSALAALPTLGRIVLFALVMLLLAPRLMRPLLRRFERHGQQLDHTLLTGIYILVLLAATLTAAIGIDVIFGGFLLGVVLPRNAAFLEALRIRTDDFVSLVLLPVFFTTSGLSTNLRLINQPSLWALTLLVVAVAVAGKFLGAWGTARLVGIDRRDAWNLGWLMNTRGLTELVILNIGLHLGVISPLIFSLFVLMALITTLMAGPLLRLRPQAR